MNYMDFAHKLVSTYAQWDDVNDLYHLHIFDIPDFELDAFAGLLMANDKDLANEATCSDNPEYLRKMLPALLTYLSDTTDKDKLYEFTKAWREGVVSYFQNNTQEIINNLCTERLHREMNDNGFYAKRRPDNGELYWSRI